MDRTEYLNQLNDWRPGDEPVTNTEIPQLDPDPPPGWSVVGYWHLSPEQNGGNHNVYVDLLDENGDLMQPNSCLLRFTWDGMTPEETPAPIPFDKLAPEPGANFPVYLGQVCSIWIEDDPIINSDQVDNLRCDLPDEGGGNTYGHHSFYIVYRLFTDGRGRGRHEHFRTP